MFASFTRFCKFVQDLGNVLELLGKVLHVFAMFCKILQALGKVLRVSSGFCKLFQIIDKDLQDFASYWQNLCKCLQVLCLQVLGKVLQDFASSLQVFASVCKSWVPKKATQGGPGPRPPLISTQDSRNFQNLKNRAKNLFRCPPIDALS